MENCFLRDLLTEEQALLLKKIEDKNRECYHLPELETSKRIGFGCFLDFYMFWIGAKRGRVYFGARLQFYKAKQYNTVHLPFVPAKERMIFEAIEEIHRSYLCYTEDPEGFMARRPQRRAKCSLPPQEDLLLQKSLQQSPWMAMWETVKEQLAAFDPEGSAPDRACAPREEDALTVSEAFDGILDHLSTHTRNPSIAFDVLRQYIGSDKVSLAHIGEAYDLSRERIRQLCVKAKKRFLGSLKWTIRRDERLLDRLNRLTEGLYALCGKAIDIPLLFNLPLFSQRRNAFFVELFWGKEALWLFDSFKKARKKAAEIESKKKKAISSTGKDFCKLEARICYPTDKVAAAPPPASLSGEGTPLYVGKFKKKLEAMSDQVSFIENPDIIYYTTTKIEHRPHFLLKTKDGKCVLVVLVSIKKMALHYNLNRFNALHEYCVKNGYGYLILSETGHSIYDLKEMELEPALTAELDDFLEETGHLLFSDIERLKGHYKITDTVLTAYVLQRRLSFSLLPFRIKKRML